MWYWFGLSALALIGELLSGTFYLLLVALAFVAAGGASALGLGLPVQLVVCAVVGVVGALALRRLGVLRWRGDATADADVNLDIGQIVNVTVWEPDGTARIWYRGAHWQAEAAGASPHVPGAHRIVGIRGSLLLVEPVAPDTPRP